MITIWKITTFAFAVLLGIEGVVMVWNADFATIENAVGDLCIAASLLLYQVIGNE